MTGKARSTFIACLGMGFGLLLSGAAAAGPEAEALPWDEVRLFTEVLERVKANYVEPVDDRQLFAAALRGMLGGLDPYSQFLDAEDYAGLLISSSGHYSGVGLELSMRDGRVLVVSPIEGTPAARAGIRSGDLILGVDGLAVEPGNVQEAVARLRGAAGSRVQLKIARAGEPATLDFELVRSDVQLHSVRARLLEPGLGYLRISQFSESTAGELREALASLGNGAGTLHGLVLDLRNNPGGMLGAAVEVSDSFLDGGIIVTASGQGRDASFRHEASAGDLLAGAPIVVMVNEGSASAAEIVAGALRDNDRALLVGSRTFGKGSVQTLIRLSSGEAIKLTTSRYFRPSGASIHGAGIVPDVVLEDAGVPALAPLADPALERALQLLKQGLSPAVQPTLAGHDPSRR
ncbi:MAG: S41 family peptidase [Gammaproteobacteria bacterium]|nr:S41 family peptidase [Gammaproteobacteria bacterium]